MLKLSAHWDRRITNESIRNNFIDYRNFIDRHCWDRHGVFHRLGVTYHRVAYGAGVNLFDDIYISKETGKVVGVMYEDVDYKLVPIKQEDEK